MPGRPPRFATFHSVRRDGRTVIDVNLNRPNEEQLPVVGCCEFCDTISSGYTVPRSTRETVHGRWPCPHCKRPVSVPDYLNIIDATTGEIIRLRRPNEEYKPTALTGEQLRALAEAAEAVRRGESEEALIEAIEALPARIRSRFRRYLPKTSTELAAWAALLVTAVVPQLDAALSSDPKPDDDQVVYIVDKELGDLSNQGGQPSGEQR